MKRRKNQEMKTTMSEMKNTLSGMKSRLNIGKEKVGALENTAMEQLKISQIKLRDVFKKLKKMIRVFVGHFIGVPKEAGEG